MSRVIPVVASLFIVGVLSYVAGMWTTHKDWPAWRLVEELRPALRSWRDTGHILPERAYARRTAGLPAERYVVEDASRLAPGHIAINRFDADRGGYVTDLIDDEGNVAHSWFIDYSKVIPGGAPSEFSHAVLPLPDGSIVAGFDEVPGLARFDACGTPVWTRDDSVYHHVLSLDPDEGGIWVWASRYWDGGHDQRLTRIDAETGETLEEIDLVRDVIEPDPAARLAFRVPEDFRWNFEARSEAIHDIFHPNDIEALPAAWADAFPGLEAGDLLISLRSIDFIGIIDRRTKRLKWWQAGPWEWQHDPDFHADGTITVYNNNTERFRSSIVELDFATGALRDRFAGSALDFDSYIMGQHQRLPNGNWLVVSPVEGRVIETAPDGTPLRHYQNVLGPAHNAVVTTAVHVPPGFYESLPSCPR